MQPLTYIEVEKLLNFQVIQLTSKHYMVEAILDPDENPIFQ